MERPMLPARSDISDVATYESRREWVAIPLRSKGGRTSGLTATVTAITVSENNITQSLVIEFTTLNYGEILRRCLVAGAILPRRRSARRDLATQVLHPGVSGRAAAGPRELQPDSGPHERRGRRPTLICQMNEFHGL